MLPNLPTALPRPPLLLLALATVACTGPSTHLENPSQYRVFVDGRAVQQPELPFRYYGTSRWDAQPTEALGKPDWAHQPASGAMPMPAPVSPWLFPFDFPLELLSRALHGREDRTVVIGLPPTPPELRPEPESAPEIGAFHERASLARISR